MRSLLHHDAGSMTFARTGTVVSSTVWGKIIANCRLSGETFTNQLTSRLTMLDQAHQTSF